MAVVTLHGMFKAGRPTVRFGGRNATKWIEIESHDSSERITLFCTERDFTTFVAAVTEGHGEYHPSESLGLDAGMHGIPTLLEKLADNAARGDARAFNLLENAIMQAVVYLDAGDPMIEETRCAVARQRRALELATASGTHPRPMGVA